MSGSVFGQKSGEFYRSVFNQQRAEQLTVTDLSADTLTLEGDLNVPGNLSVAGNETVGGTLAVGGTTTSTGKITAQNDLTVGGNLSVTGTTALTGAVTAQSSASVGGPLTVTGGSTLIGPVSASSTVDVTGNQTVGGTLAVTGAVTASSTVDVTGNETVGGTLAVTGASTLTGPVTASSTVDVTGNETVGGTLAVTGASTLSGPVTAASTLDVTGNETVGGTLSVTGAVTASSTVDVTGNETVGGTLAVTGASTLSGPVTAASTLDVTGNETVGGTLSVTGAVTASSTMDVTGNETVGGTLAVTGASTFTGDGKEEGDFEIVGSLSVGTSDKRRKVVVSSDGGLTLPTDLDASIVSALTSTTNSGVGVMSPGRTFIHFGNGTTGKSGALEYDQVTKIMELWTNGAKRTILDSSGHLYPATDNAYDSGSTTSNWRNIYVKSVTQYEILLGDTNGRIKSLGTKGTSGQVLTSQGASADPIWSSASGATKLNDLTDCETANTTGNIIRISGDPGATGVIIGQDAGTLQNISTSTNTLIGRESGQSIGTGASNCCVGYQSGKTITTGSNNTIIGDNANVWTSAATNTIAIGKGCLATQNDGLYFGTHRAISPISPGYAYWSSTTQELLEDPKPVVKTAIIHRTYATGYNMYITGGVWTQIAMTDGGYTSDGVFISADYLNSRLIINRDGIYKVEYSFPIGRMTGSGTWFITTTVFKNSAELSTQARCRHIGSGDWPPEFAWTTMHAVYTSDIPFVQGDVITLRANPDASVGWETINGSLQATWIAP